MNRINVIITRRNMVKTYLIDGKSISSNPQYRGKALRAISRLLYMVFDNINGRQIGLLWVPTAMAG